LFFCVVFVSFCSFCFVGASHGVTHGSWTELICVGN
jgi:hypothetical protein